MQVEIKMKIGILEDNYTLGRILQLSLTVAGHTVHLYHTLEDFLAFITSSPSVSLMIIDFFLNSDSSGIDVIYHIRTILPELPAILISALPLDNLEAATRGLSRVKILQKPFATSILLEMIQTSV